MERGHYILSLTVHGARDVERRNIFNIELFALCAYWNYAIQVEDRPGWIIYSQNILDLLREANGFRYALRTLRELWWDLNIDTLSIYLFIHLWAQLNIGCPRVIVNMDPSEHRSSVDIAWGAARPCLGHLLCSFPEWQETSLRVWLPVTSARQPDPAVVRRQKGIWV